MIARLEKALAGLILLLLAAAGVSIWALVERQRSLSAEKEMLAGRVSALERRIRVSRDLKEGAHQNRRLIEMESNEPLKEIPFDCGECFKSTKMEIDIEDENGWWKYQDKNAFDDKAGSFTLTDRFWEEALDRVGPPVSTETGKAGSKGKLKTLRLESEKSLRAGVGLSGYEVEMSYSPAGFRGGSWSLDLDIRSRVSYNSFAFENIKASDSGTTPLRSEISMGVSLRW